MYLQTFRAASMREALDLVRRDLGHDAVILSTRHVRLRRRFPWQSVRHEAEVVAGVIAGAESSKDAAMFEANQEVSPRPESQALPDTGLDLSAVPPGQVWNRSRGDARETGGPLAAPDIAESVSGTVLDAREPHALSQRLDTIESLITQLNQAARRKGRDDVPDELFHLYTQLIDADVDDAVAREMVFALRRESGGADLRDAAQVQHALAGWIERNLPCRGAITVAPGRRKTVALVGPTGVGKTTTIAKLAANFKLRDRVRLGLVTVDTYRVAAVEQLRTYADIMEVPMKVVTSPRELRRALDELSSVDLVLIDTAGRSPRDELRIQELRGFLNEANVDEVHLVLSVSASARSLEQTAEKFRAVSPTALLATKLDEAPGLGALLTAATRIRLPLSYFTTGQDVPDDIEAAAAGRAARLILGQEELFQRRAAA